VARAHALLRAKTSQGADADLARTRALTGYKSFLSLWKDADPDIPTLSEPRRCGFRCGDNCGKDIG